MKRFLLFAYQVAFFAAAITMSPAHAATPAVTADEATNLARLTAGTEIECVAPDGRVSTLTSPSHQTSAEAVVDADTLDCPLAQGHTTLLIKLPAASLLDRFTFINENAAAAGDLKISVSNFRLPATSEKWVPVDGRVVFSNKRLFNVSMLGVEAHYVKLDFTTEKPGRVAGLGLYGAVTLDRTHAQMPAAGNGRAAIVNKSSRPPIADFMNFDYANLWARAHVVYVSSGAMKTARRMIDDNTTTAFDFAPNDPHPTAIIALGQTEPLHRVRALYSARPGRLEVYLLDELRADPGDLRDGKVIASVVDDQRTGKAVLDFNPEGARYVALRWTPIGEPDGKPFEVAEINAFGNIPLTLASLTPTPEAFASLTSTTAPSLPNIPSLPQIPVVSP